MASKTPRTYAEVLTGVQQKRMNLIDEGHLVWTGEQRESCEEISQVRNETCTGQKLRKIRVEIKRAIILINLICLILLRENKLKSG